MCCFLGKRFSLARKKTMTTQQVYDEVNQTYLMFEVPDIEDEHQDGSEASLMNYPYPASQQDSYGPPDSNHHRMSYPYEVSSVYSPAHERHNPFGAAQHSAPSGLSSSPLKDEMENAVVPPKRNRRRRNIIMATVLFILLAVAAALTAFFLLRNSSSSSRNSSYSSPRPIGVVTSSTPLLGTKVTSIAGNGSAGQGVGVAKNVPALDRPWGVATYAGETYVADVGANVIRKITAAGIISTFAGSGTKSTQDGEGRVATFSGPWGLAFDGQGNLFVADSDGHKIRMISPNGVVSTFAGSGTAGSQDGQGIAASFNKPFNLLFASDGTLYVTDNGNAKIRKISPSGQVTTFAGSGVKGKNDGNAAEAQFSEPIGMAWDSAGNIVVSDYSNNNIRLVSSTGQVSTWVGSGAAGMVDGQGTAAQFSGPGGVATDAAGYVYVTDGSNLRIRVISPTGRVSQFAGSGIEGDVDATGVATNFRFLGDMTIDSSGDLIVVDTANHKVKKLSK